MEAAPATVRVNLLPREYVERARARRTVQYTIGAVLLFVAILGGLYFLRMAEVWRAEEAREEASFQVARLDSELAQLSEYRQLADLLENRRALLASAMEKDIAFSTMLNNLSLVFPANASLTTFTVTAAGPVVATEGEITFGEAAATGEFTGYSIERFSPGVETVIVDLDRTPSFFNAFVTSAAEDELEGTGVTTFTGTVGLDSGAYTGRYADGLPPEVTP